MRSIILLLLLSSTCFADDCCDEARERFYNSDDYKYGAYDFQCNGDDAACMSGYSCDEDCQNKRDQAAAVKPILDKLETLEKELKALKEKNNEDDKN